MLVKLSIRFIMANCLEYCSMKKFLFVLSDYYKIAILDNNQRYFGTIVTHDILTWATV